MPTQPRPIFLAEPWLLLISRKGIKLVLDQLASRDIPVLGLEGFELHGSDVRPLLDLIYDKDGVTGFPEPVEVIQTWPEDVWIDVTISNLP
jgi:hypothetical protein